MLFFKYYESTGTERHVATNSFVLNSFHQVFRHVQIRISCVHGCKRKSIHVRCLQLSGKLRMLLFQPGLVLCEGCALCLFVYLCVFALRAQLSRADRSG